mmetsp:Transcript_2064/g.2774  ORF Transcript_2064/g.2774 Transcript_2064/m.2774 type:complete len:247 (+) Transcript_2064:36-776(+)
MGGGQVENEILDDQSEIPWKNRHSNGRYHVLQSRLLRIQKLTNKNQLLLTLSGIFFVLICLMALSMHDMKLKLKDCENMILEQKKIQNRRHNSMKKQIGAISDEVTQQKILSTSHHSENLSQKLVSDKPGIIFKEGNIIIPENISLQDALPLFQHFLDKAISEENQTSGFKETENLFFQDSCLEEKTLQPKRSLKIDEEKEKGTEKGDLPVKQMKHKSNANNKGKKQPKKKRKQKKGAKHHHKSKW